MTDISLTIDETSNGETLYCKELDKFLQIYILDKSAIAAQRQEAVDAVARAQAVLDHFDVTVAKSSPIP